MSKHTDLKKSLAIAGLCFLILGMLFSAGFLSNIQLKLSDRMYGGLPVDSDIVIVSIDDKSLQSIGRWPWDRAVFADLVSKVSSAKVIGLDVAYFEKSNNVSDTLLSQSFKEAGNVVLPLEFSTFDTSSGKAVGMEALFPIAGLKEYTTQGYVNIQTDGDGVTRSVNLDLSPEHKSFVEQVYSVLRPGEVVPPESRFLINYAESPGAFKRFSISDVLSGAIPPSFFDDKVVFIGATAPNLHDDYFVPTSEGVPMPGVEIHANTLQTLLTKNYLNNQSMFSVLFFILLSVLIVWFFIFRYSIKIAGIVSVLLVFAYVFLAINLFYRGIVMNLVYVPLSLIVSYCALVSYSYLSEQRQRQWINDAFGKYVSPQLIEQMVADPSKLKLGGEARTITIFFSDIRGFTPISEALTPEGLVALLNEFLTAMTDIIMASGGTVDKYMGDAIMAFWNAPLDQPEHPYLAAQSALDQMKRLAELRVEWKKRGLPFVDIGIGLNTGRAIVGNMGSSQRFDYTGMGDTINLGSRLEGVNKQYGTHIIVSEHTEELIRDRFLLRPMDKIRVKGRAQPLMIYELLNNLEEASETELEYAEAFEAGMDLYFKQKWRACQKHFVDMKKKYIKKIDSCEISCQLYIDRAKDFAKKSPGSKWDGVYTMKTK